MCRGLTSYIQKKKILISKSRVTWRANSSWRTFSTLDLDDLFLLNPSQNLNLNHSFILHFTAFVFLIHSFNKHLLERRDIS